MHQLYASVFLVRTPVLARCTVTGSPFCCLLSPPIDLPYSATHIPASSLKYFLSHHDPQSPCDSLAAQILSPSITFPHSEFRPFIPYPPYFTLWFVYFSTIMSISHAHFKPTVLISLLCEIKMPPTVSVTVSPLSLNTTFCPTGVTVSDKLLL